ncbi:MAG TPA: PAS domain-containing protein [Caulobacteraceae bacterium]|nr:PAS domain-containing protein [Caulobacteraceae bacterium]
MSVNVGGAAALRAHQELIAYWRQVRGSARLARRRDIDPAGIKRLLPNILLIDVLERPRDYRMRLAGTAFYEVFGGEITGRRLADVHTPEGAAYWRDELDAVVGSRRPRVGWYALDWRNRARAQILWLRLPLAANGADVNMILGYDAVVGLAGQDAGGGRAA